MATAMKVKAAGAQRMRGVRRMALGLLMAVAGTVAVSAWADALEPGGPRGPRGGGFGGPSLFMGGPEHIGRAVDHLLTGLNATDAQRSQIKQIAQAASADLKTELDAARGLRQQGLALFTAPVVDAGAVEQLRLQSLARHDHTSQRVTRALLDISAVLTPEQRVKLGERIRQRVQHRPPAN